jgi:WD40 repeat protein
MAELKQTHLLEGHGNTVYSLSFSPDDRQLASGSFDRQVNIWTL